jgi:hypothetical protein
MRRVIHDFFGLCVEWRRQTRTSDVHVVFLGWVGYVGWHWILQEITCNAMPEANQPAECAGGKRRTGTRGSLAEIPWDPAIPAYSRRGNT